LDIKVNKLRGILIKMSLIVRSNIKKVVKDLQGNDEQVTSIAEEVGLELEKKVEDLLIKGISRAKANKRRTLQARDL
jgi:division protein CdvB (Snf7/Vps24/ESCRT-III family)